MVTDSRSPSRSRSRSPKREKKSSRRRRDSPSSSRSRSRTPPRKRSRSGDRRAGSGSPDRSRGDARKNHDGTYKKNTEVSNVVGVFGMSLRTEERDLERKFGKFGKIEKCVLVWNHRERRSRGYGFVTFEDEQDAADAVEAMNGKEVDGRALRVDFSFTKKGNPPRSRRDYSRSPPRRRRSRSPPRRRRSRSRSPRRDRDRRR